MVTGAALEVRFPRFEVQEDSCRVQVLVLVGGSWTRVVIRRVPDRCEQAVQGLRGKLAAGCAGQER